MSLVNKFLSNITQIKHAVKVSDQNSPVLDCSLNYSHENLNKNLFPLCTNMHREKKHKLRSIEFSQCTLAIKENLRNLK